MTSDPHTVHSNFSLIWKIRNFRQYLDLKREKLDSPPFKIRCSETTKWCLSLRTRQTFLDCSLSRLHRSDNLGDIQVKYKMYVIDENGNSHFEKSNIVELNHNNRVIKEKEFLDSSSLEDRHLPGKTLKLQCDLELLVDQDKAAEWNCNSDLIGLSNDLMLLYGMEEISDEIVTFEDVDFQVHSFVIAARCPQLFNDMADAYNSSPSDSTETSYTDSSTEQAISISPMRAIGYYSYRSESVVIPRYPRLDETELEWYAGNRIDEIFTRPACEAALRYLYSGKVDTNDHKIKSQLHIISCFYRLSDLRGKLEDVANACFAVTDFAVDKMYVLFDSETFSNWSQIGFKPVTRLINLAQTPYLRYLSITFTIQNTDHRGQELKVSCRFVKGRFPITLKVRFQVFYTHTTDTPEALDCKTFDFDEIWHPSFPIDTTNKGAYFRCTFSACNTELKQMVKQEYFLNSHDSPHGKSLRQFSLDFANMLQKTRTDDFDLSLIAKGKLVRAHRTIVYARSPVFREHLLPKMHDDNRIVHLVRGIEYDVLKKLIEYMYTGHTNLKEFPKVKELCAAAKRFRVSELIRACNSYLESKMDEE